MKRAKPSGIYQFLLHGISSMECDDCDGTGYTTMYDYEVDDDGEEHYVEWEDVCSSCGGEGIVIEYSHPFQDTRYMNISDIPLREEVGGIDRRLYVTRNLSIERMLRGRI